MNICNFIALLGRENEGLTLHLEYKNLHTKDAFKTLDDVTSKDYRTSFNSLWSSSHPFLLLH